MHYHSITSASHYNGRSLNNPEGEYAFYEMILHLVEERLDFMVSRHSKVLFVRFDVHFPEHWRADNRNKHISELFTKIQNHLSYRRIHSQYVWVREQNRMDRNQHYHVALMLNGNKVRGYYWVLENITNFWSKVLCDDASGLINYCDRDANGIKRENGIMIVRPSSNASGDEYLYRREQYETARDTCMQMTAYIAKAMYKNLSPPGVRRFQPSQMK